MTAMHIKEAIVERIKGLCQERDIAYNALATSAGITPSTVYSVMDGSRRDMSVITLKKICDGLDMPLHVFFNHPLFHALEQEIE